MLVMGGGGASSDGDGDWAVLPFHPLADITLALVGKIGSGKSATANSILGTEAFASKRSYSGVTETCQKNSTTFHDGCVARTVHVIDSPGLFDMDTTTEDVHKEIAKCMDMARDGIHAMLIVFSAASRFSREDEETIQSIKLFFGDEILDHAILVFTHGDEFEGEKSWKEMLHNSAPGCLKEMLELFTNRVVLFNNKTSDMHQHQLQLKILFDAVDLVMSRNCGQPFSNQMLKHIQEAHQISESKKHMYDEYLTHITQMVEEKLNITIKRLENQLLEEQKTRQTAETTLREEIRRLEESLKKAQKESEDAREENERRRKAEESSRGSSGCIIL